METAIQFNDDKQMMLKVHQRFTTRPQLELKGDAWFNTVTGSLTYKASLKKYVSLSARTKDAGSTPLRIAWVTLNSTEPRRQRPLHLPPGSREDSQPGHSDAHSNRNHSARASALAAALKPSLFVEVRENNWAAQYKHERFSVTYDL
ncbi:MAG: hypothetical protein WDW38_000192 [Sanguina aurantia]